MMMDINPYRQYAEEYDRWYDEHKAVYLSELSCIKEIIPSSGRGLEVGVGTGRFASSLGIRWGLDPSGDMLERAHGRGVRVVRGESEGLPFTEETFDFVLFVTAICFLSDPARSLEEAARVVRPGGSLIIGMVDRDSSLGRQYQAKKEKSRFYRQATFYSVPEILRLLPPAGWRETAIRQTLLEKSDPEQAAREGYGEGGFVVISARKIW